VDRVCDRAQSAHLAAEPVSDALAIVQAWHRAVNAGDVDTLVSLSTEDVEVGGPRGSGHGASLLREWFGRAGIRLDPERAWQRDEVCVVAQRARWSGPDGGPGAPQDVASVFRVRNGRVASVVRYGDVAEALAASGLSQADLVAAPG
jgi:ketosteroid isomerase-like protein